MSVVSVLNVTVNDNPAPFGAPYEFEITFECLEALQKDLEWKLTYVGSATSSEHDQVLDTLLVGPVPVGINKFTFQADPPNLSRIPNTEIIGVTVILLSCAYDDREFVRIGYYVNNEYTDEALIDDPPAKPVIEKVRRSILAEKPRVTRFAIKWDSESSAPPEFPPDQPEADAAEDDEAKYGADEEDEEEGVEEEVREDGEDMEMGGTDEAMASARSKADAEEDEEDAGSEDLEGESSGSEEEEEAEGEGELEDEDMEMGDDHGKVANHAERDAKQSSQSDVMVH